MRTGLHIFLFVLIGFGVKAQQNYFVYVQADNKQPFFVKINDKLLSSSETGYMVIPKLVPGDYALTIGFPKDIFPAQTMTLVVGNADAGYQLKNYGDKGWGLYNIQTLAVTMSGTAPVKHAPVPADDEFANVLSGVSNAPVKPAVTIPSKPDAAIVSSASGIKKIDGSDAPEGRYIVYADVREMYTDTIRIFIPAAAASVKTETKPQNNTITEPVKDTKFLDIELPNPNSKPDTTRPVAIKEEVPVAKVDLAPAKQPGKPVVSFNSDCRANANDDDFLKARKKMAAASSEEGMTDAAAKMFKQKCYSVEQIKNLSLLFLTDAGKYKFFDAAYPHTHDTQNFNSLQSELHDAYYVNRFHAMLRN